ncbi:hypothetical protein JQ615_29770 [Bradyrhizobium jicamae]|uniref:Uncharacterized protein n=1 Tax=Bradyrhizobium jicamae TaxID=280332 RepID=A0ABS5FS19_9BRAD|nr:hypothetical protein [Bradyrhizobium jicamae]MBR0799568.1 hypothetical protein [Bradyrhizobium jicamae]
MIVTGSLGLLSLVVAARAEDNSQNCSDTFSFLNDNPKLDAFDRMEGSKNRRLEFRLSGKQPCSEHECRLGIVRKASRPAASDHPEQLATDPRFGPSKARSRLIGIQIANAVIPW